MKKIIGIIIVMLLIGTAIPVYSTMNIIDSDVTIKSTPYWGDHLRFMFFDMHIRSYMIHMPSSYDGSNPIPLVFALHGITGNSNNFRSYTGLNEKADEEGFIVVYPNGGTDISFLFTCLMYYGIRGFPGFYWNSWDSYDFDDVGFIRVLIDTIQSEYKINESRVYVTGFSNGGYMTYRLGAELSDILAAIAPVGGSIGGVWDWWNGVESPLYIIPEPENPLPVIVFHGMKDNSVPYDGAKNPKTDGIFQYSVNESVSFWVEHNNCNPLPEIVVSESGNIITRSYSNGDGGTEVVLYTIVDGGHVWFGSKYSPCEISCNDLMWKFFESHPKH